jgi:hypothetical protein
LSSGLWRRVVCLEQVSAKRLYTFTRLHGVTLQKTVYFIVTTTVWSYVWTHHNDRNPSWLRREGCCGWNLSILRRSSYVYVGRVLLETGYLEDRDVGMKIIIKLIFMHMLSRCDLYLKYWRLNIMPSFLNLTGTLELWNNTLMIKNRQRGDVI